MVIFMLPAKHGRHIGIMSVVVVLHCHTSDIQLFKGYINFIQSLQKGKALLNTGQVRI